MENNGIKITISKSDGNGNVVENAKSKVDGSKPASQFGIQAFNTAIIEGTKQLAQYGISQYGNITGNTSVDNRISQATTMISYGLQVTTGGAVGAVAVAVQLGIAASNNYINNRKANQEAELLAQRSGLASVNGGR